MWQTLWLRKGPWIQRFGMIWRTETGCGEPFFGGGSGIRTHVTVSRKHAFQACAFSHSAIPPCRPVPPHQPGSKSPKAEMSRGYKFPATWRDRSGTVRRQYSRRDRSDKTSPQNCCRHRPHAVGRPAIDGAAIVRSARQTRDCFCHTRKSTWKTPCWRPRDVANQRHGRCREPGADGMAARPHGRPRNPTIA
jgi:hypothetical protein